MSQQKAKRISEADGEVRSIVDLLVFRASEVVETLEVEEQKAA